MMKRTLAVLLMAVVLTAGAFYLNSGVQADGPDYNDPVYVEQMMIELNSSPDPMAAYEALPPEGQEAAIRWVTPVEERVTETIQTDYLFDVDPGNPQDQCKTKTREKTKTNFAGIAYLKYISKTRWCYNGTEIVGTPKFTRSGEVALSARLTWTFVGHIDKDTSWGPNRSYWWDYTEGRFKYKLGPVVKYWEPSISKTVYANGS